VNAGTNLSELSKINYAWDRSTFVETGGWAIMPGSGKADPEVAKVCAEMLTSLKAADLRE